MQSYRQLEKISASVQPRRPVDGGDVGEKLMIGVHTVSWDLDK